MTTTPVDIVGSTSGPFVNLAECPAATNPVTGAGLQNGYQSMMDNAAFFNATYVHNDGGTANDLTLTGTTTIPIGSTVAQNGTIASNGDIIQSGVFASDVRLGDTTGSHSITGATNATPIVVTTSTHHYSDGDLVDIAGVGVNTAANGQWVIDVLTSTTFALVGSAGNGVYTSGGTAIKKGQVAYETARTVTRALTSTFNDGYHDVAGDVRLWSCNSNGEFVCANGTPTTDSQRLGFNIGADIVPDGAKITIGTMYIQPDSGHGGVPGTLPTVTVIKVALGSNTASILATQTLGGVDPAYQAVAASLGTPEIVDHSRSVYRVILTTETGVNARANTHVMGATVTFTTRTAGQN